MNYKSAQIYYGSKTGKDIAKEWYIYYSYRNPKTNKFERFILKKGINRFHTLAERTQAANELRDATNLALKEGFSPFETSGFSERRSFVEALEYALGIKKLYCAHDTWLDYRNHLKFVKQAIERVGYDQLPIQSIKRIHIQTVFHHLRSTGISAHRYNTFLTTMKSLFTGLIDDGIIESSPIHGLKGQRKPESKGYDTYSDLKPIIKERAYEYSFSIGLIIETLYLTGMRPNEILGLQMKSINWGQSELELLPLSKSERGEERITKTLSIRRMPVPKELLVKYKQHIENSQAARKVKEIPEKWFLFTGKWAFLCGPNKLHRDHLTSVWIKHIRRDDLPKSVKLYGLKHTRAKDLVDADIPIEAIKDLFGHKSVRMTRIYAQNLKEKNAQIIRDQGPSFD